MILKLSMKYPLAEISSKTFTTDCLINIRGVARGRCAYRLHNNYTTAVGVWNGL